VAFLIVEAGDGQGRKIDLSGPLVIGRQARAGLSIRDAKASREHTRLEPAAGGWAAVDLGSTNGTLVNGRKIDREFLKAGDRVTVGQTVFRFETGDASPFGTTKEMKETPVVRIHGPIVPSGPAAPAAPPAPPSPAAPSPAAVAAARAGAEPMERTTGPKLRYQGGSTGPGLITYLACAAILAGLVFASKWIAQNAISKAMADKKPPVRTP
jgi:pSer/pThr/pTyr-binding forkhead associated (FHA) protein